MDNIQDEFNQLLINSIQDDNSVHEKIKIRITPYILQKKSQHIIWNLLHSLSVLFPENPTDIQKENIKQLILNIKSYMPFCTICSNNGLDNFVETSNLDIIINNKSELIKFLIDYHTFININLTKHKNYDTSLFTIDYIYNKYSNGLYDQYLQQKYNISFLNIINCNVDFNTYFKQVMTNLTFKIIQEINNLNYDIEVKINIKL